MRQHAWIKCPSCARTETTLHVLKAGRCDRYQPHPCCADASSLQDPAIWGIPPFFVERGPRPVHSGAVNSFDFHAPTTSRNAMRVLRALQVRKSILLEGSPGVGKTALVSALAKAAGDSPPSASLLLCVHSIWRVVISAHSLFMASGLEKFSCSLKGLYKDFCSKSFVGMKLIPRHPLLQQRMHRGLRSVLTPACCASSLDAWINAKENVFAHGL